MDRYKYVVIGEPDDAPIPVIETINGEYTHDMVIAYHDSDTECTREELENIVFDLYSGDFIMTGFYLVNKYHWEA